MKKVMLLLLLVCLVLPLAAYAGPRHEDVDGYFTYVPTPGSCDENYPGPNAVWLGCEDVGDYYAGSFDGDSTEVYDFIMMGFEGFHPAGFPLYERGFYKGTVTFTGTVEDSAQGTMEIMFVGTSPSSLGGEFIWNGTWRILSGEGGLAGIHGNGQWGSAEDPVDGVHYWGHIHFAP